MTRSATLRLPLAALLAAACATPAFGIRPQTWVHNTEADFASGETEDTVVTNLGDVKLSAEAEPIADAPEDVTIFSDLQPLGDATYIAGGPRGAILRRQGDAIETVAALADEQVFALDVIGDRLLVAVSGNEESRLAVLDGDGLRTVAVLPGVRYIWDVLVVDGRVILATGIEGKVLALTPALGADADPAAVEVTQILDTEQANVLVLARDGDGRLYAGTDTDGLVYRLTRNDDGGYEAFVVYDADEPEVGALLALDDGTVYAGTADAEQARPGRLEEAQTEATGRPEVTVEPPAEGDEPAVPEPGDLPQVPPEAEPIGQPDAGAAEDPAAALEGLDEVEARPQMESVPVLREGPSALQADAAEDLPDAEPADATAPAEPTPEQYDRLRAIIRERLEQARRTGRLQVGGAGMVNQNRVAAPAGESRARPASPQTASQEGNAVYRIDPQGFVSEVFRESVMILKMVRAGDRLLVATGNEGQVFLVDPLTGETTAVADVDPEQIPAIIAGGEGQGLLVATANPAQLLALNPRVAERGTFTSPVMDAEQISLWGTLDLTGTIPEGTRVLLQTRSGNVEDPETAPWSPWSEPQAVTAADGMNPLTPREVAVDAPPARFLQYQLTLEGIDATSPIVDRVEITYVTPNMKPQIASLRASYPEPPSPNDRDADPAPATNLTIEWEASDPNQDTLVYRLEYQPAGSDAWLPIVDDLRETRYEWATRRAPDGRYLVRVVASDRPDNPGDMAKLAVRRSDPVLVDNTSPEFEGLEHETGAGVATIRGTAADGLSAITSIAYAVDADEDFEPVLPTDLILDSTQERFEVRLSDLSPGAHVVTLRVTDARGNTRFEPVLLQIRK